jgi:ribosome biogenesis GTPase A
MPRASLRAVGPYTSADSPRSLLDRIRDVAARRGHEATVREAQELVRRVDEGKFFLAVVGQFKRGKSSLVNALLGAPLLPTGVLPVTAVVTVVEYDRQPSVVIEKQDGTEEVVPLAAIGTFIAEEGNPSNRRGVAAAIVRHPSALLRGGVCLVDTPGIGSVFELNTEATHAFVPKVDAALVVLGADPPISADELALVHRIAAEVPDLIFVLNKADLVAEADRRTVADFCARVVAERLDRPAPEILFVSAVSGEAGPAIAELYRNIEGLAERSGPRLVRSAVERGSRRLARELIETLQLERRGLAEPLAVLESQIEAFREESVKIAAMLDDLDYVLRAEVDKAVRWLETEAESFLRQERPRLAGVVRERVQNLIEPQKTQLRDAALQSVRPVLQQTLEEWLQRMEPQVQDLYRRLTARFVDVANAAAHRITSEARRTLGITVEPAPPEPGLRAASRLYYRLEGEALFLDPGELWTGLAERVLSRRRALARVAAWLAAQADGLLHTNVTRIVVDLRERIEESLRKFQFELRERLSGILRAAEEAQLRAAEVRARGTAAVASELQALDAAIAELDSIDRGATDEVNRDAEGRA